VYQGVDRSEYVVRRFGRRRDIRLGTIGTLGRLRLRRCFDLVVCSDVLQYLTTPELRRGLAALRRLAGGVLWLDAYTAEDRFVGDREGWQRRSERAWRRLFTEAGLVSCGLNCWVPRRLERRLAALERGRLRRPERRRPSGSRGRYIPTVALIFAAVAQSRTTSK
jgi:hypothetical protein